VEPTRTENILEQGMTVMKNSSKKISRKRMVLVVGACLGCFLCAPAVLGDQSTATALIASGAAADGNIRLPVGKSTVLTLRVPAKRVNVGTAEIADVNLLSPTNVLVTAKKPGGTQLIVWDDQERSQVVDVVVDFDLAALNEQYKSTFPGAAIDVSTANGAIVLKGRVPSVQVADQAVAMASPFSTKVLNFLEVAGAKQIQLEVKFAEVSKSATNALGVNFAATDGVTIFGNNTGQVNPFGVSGGLLGLPTPGAEVNIFGKGAIGNTAFAYYISALRQNNLLRILAEPNLVTMSGQEASFLAGGEFPVPVSQGSGSGSGGGAAITVEYREFGVRLKMTPVVLGNGKIRLKVAPEVSDLDFTTAVRFNGYTVPGLTSRKVETTIEIGEGQSFAIAGLLNNNVTANREVTPLLGDLPVVGALFRSVRYQRKETELVVVVTPRLVEPMNPAQVPTLPGEKWRDPSELELFFNRDLGGPAANPKNLPSAEQVANNVPPRFQGTYGYSPASEAETASVDGE
jgi:pilus assembly protein CpaC